MAIWKGSHNPILSRLKYSRRCLLTTETNWDDAPSTERRQLGERRGVVADLLVHRMGWIFWRCFFLTTEKRWGLLLQCLCAWNHVSWFSLFIWGEHVSVHKTSKRSPVTSLGWFFVKDTYMLGKYSIPFLLMCVCFCWHLGIHHVDLGGFKQTFWGGNCHLESLGKMVGWCHHHVERPEKRAQTVV